MSPWYWSKYFFNEVLQSSRDWCCDGQNPWTYTIVPGHGGCGRTVVHVVLLYGAAWCISLPIYGVKMAFSICGAIAM